MSNSPHQSLLNSTCRLKRLIVMDSINAMTRIITGDDGNDYQEVREEDEIEVISTNREKTDFPVLIAHGIFVFVLIFFLSYCVLYGDVDRLLVGYDKCGNVCGKRNNLDFDFITNCISEDMRELPFLDVVQRRCIQECVGMTKIGHRCFPSAGDSDSSLERIGRDLHHCSSELTGLSFLTLGFSFIIFLILRYLTAAFVWTTIFGVISVCAALSGFCWYLTGTTDAFTPVAIFFSIITIILLLVILFLRKRIELVIQLLKEAGKAISSVPLLVVEPLLTVLAIGLTLIAWVYFALWIESAGIPAESPFSRGVTFHKNGIVKFARWYNLFIMLWMVQFIYGCQNMILAGVVSNWYFKRNKASLKMPLLISFKNTIKYHMGTISLGSLIIALIQMLRILFRFFKRFIRYPLYLCCLCCIYTRIESGINYLEDLIKYLTRNAYIITAIHGTPFFESGTRAFKLLFENILRVIAINTIGDFVLILAKILIILSSVLVGFAVLQNKENVSNKWAVLLVVALVACLVSHCFITVYEMAVDSIFICFCEDCSMNADGTRPYFMSKSLMEFVEKSKTVLNVKEVEANVNNPAISVIA